jgi:Ni,Fe-hydrogenase maturation factor
MIVVVAHGDPLCGDGALVWRVAELLERVGDAVVPLTLRELTPELSLLLSQADGVVFVVAGTGPTPGVVRSVDLRAAVPPPEGLKLCGPFSPADVLAVTNELCGVQPRAALVTISGARGAQPDRAEAPTLTARRAVPRAVRLIRRLVRSWSLDALPEGTHLDPPRIPDA